MTTKASTACALLLYVLFALGFPSLWWPMFSAGLLAGLLYLLCRHRLAKSLELERVRLRMASDLHDDIGASLSQLAVLGEVLHRKLGDTDPQVTTTLTAMRRISSEAVDAMSDIVWTTNPQQDSLFNLARRMRRFASEMLPAAGIEFSFQAPNPEADIRLDAELRRQVFLIFKESLNNLVRHSGCTQVTIELWLTSGELTLQLNDNGHGFDPGIAVEGNGLQSLRRRAQFLGAQLSLHSDYRGTTVFLCVPYKQTAWKLSQRELARRARSLQAKCRTLVTIANTYLNRGVTRLRRRPTLRPSTIQKPTE